MLPVGPIRQLRSSNHPRALPGSPPRVSLPHPVMANVSRSMTRFHIRWHVTGTRKTTWTRYITPVGLGPRQGAPELEDKRISGEYKIGGDVFRQHECEIWSCLVPFVLSPAVPDRKDAFSVQVELVKFNLSRSRRRFEWDKRSGAAAGKRKRVTFSAEKKKAVVRFCCELSRTHEQRV